MKFVKLNHITTDNFLEFSKAVPGIIFRFTRVVKLLNVMLILTQILSLSLKNNEYKNIQSNFICSKITLCVIQGVNIYTILTIVFIFKGFSTWITHMEMS